MALLSCLIALHAAAMIGCSVAVRPGLVAPGAQDARESISEDVALLQHSKGKAFGGDTTEAEESSLTYAVRGIPPVPQCPKSHDCPFRDFQCTRSDAQRAAVQQEPACSLSKLAQNPSTTMFAIQRGDGAGTRIGQTVLSLAYASQNNMNFGGFFLDPSQKDIVHGDDQPRAMSAFLGCNYSDMLVHTKRPHFDQCWNGKDTLASGLDGQEILLLECNGMECRRDQAILTLPFLAELRKSTSLLRHATPHFTGKGLKVVIHIRRGDRLPKGSLDSARNVNGQHYASDALYLNFLRRFLQGIQNAELHVISTTEGGFASENFDVYRNLGVHVHLDGDIVDDWAHMAQADLLLIAPSTYSWVAGLLNEKCVAIFNLFPLPIVLDWIELSEDLREFKDIESCLSKKGLQS